MRFAAEFRTRIGDIMPDLLRSLLMDYRSHVKIAGANAMVQLVKYCEFRTHLNTSATYILLKAELRAMIGIAVTQLLELLKSSNMDVRDAGANAMMTLVEYREFGVSL